MKPRLVILGHSGRTLRSPRIPASAILNRCVCAYAYTVNATLNLVLQPLRDAGVSPATLARVAGVQRSSAIRWGRGAQPRKTARQRLATATALLDRRPERNLGELARWLDVENIALAGSTPATWIREGRDATMLGDAWAADAARLSVRLSGRPPFEDLDRTVAQLRQVESLFAGLDLAPLLSTVSSYDLINTRINMVAEMGRNHRLLEAASAAAQIGRHFQEINEALRGPMSGYAQIAQLLSRSEMTSAFAGMANVMSALRTNTAVFAETGMLAKLVADSRPPIGALAVAMDLQLNSAMSAALASTPTLSNPIMVERIDWRAWLPQHPAALIRTNQIGSDWLIGETHNAAHASTAALGRAGKRVDEADIAAALQGVRTEFPDLMNMPVPGTGKTLRDVLGLCAPRAVTPLDGAIERLRGGGPDDARQASVSMRSALDELAAALAPGPKKDRRRQYAAILGVDHGDADGTLLYHQIAVLYASFQPLSDAVHDELDLDALRAHAFGMFSAMAGVVSRWMARKGSARNNSS